MLELRAFALRSDYEGTVEQDGEQVPKFGGGLLAVGDGDFDVAEELLKGDGTIVVPVTDQRLLDLLDQYPALKGVTVPAGATATVSPYERRTADEVRMLAGLRDIAGAKSASKERAARALEVHDVALAAGDQEAANAITIDNADEIAKALEAGEGVKRLAAAAKAEERGSPPNQPGEGEVLELTNAQLEAVLEDDTDTFEHAGAIAIPAALEELRQRAANGDTAAQTALEERGLNVDTNREA